MKAREGDLIETIDGLILDVKGLVHPPRKVIAFPRFIPNPQGEREREGVKYSKVYNISTRFKFLEQKFPQYIVYDSVFDEQLCEVPAEDIKRYYKPVNRLRELRCCENLDELERDALKFLELLKRCTNIPWSKVGISGSLLVKLHTPKSDIDPVFYGTENCHKIYETLKTTHKDKENAIRPYSKEELQRLYQFRFQDTQTSFKDFLKTESRKVLQGKFKNRDYFIRFIKDRLEINAEYGMICYKNVGYARIKAEIEADSEAIFTPCSYELRNVTVLNGTRLKIDEIASFRGRFCEQARTGEVIIAQGKVEKVTDKRHNREHFRLLIGNKPSDFMVLA
ncbi:hypothetical protein HXY32_07195 [Candidatus Bathyarchaeota archaeon]|nr:hypothetical protein [Candidatus Bathyarchaeota archaeon]